jgi:hypothetical protein
MQEIVAKKYLLDNWQKFTDDIGVKSQRELLELLNIFQAADTCLENVYEDWQNGYDEFLDIFIDASSGAELMEAIRSHNAFYTEEEFIDYMLDRINDLREDGEDAAEVVHTWTYEGEISDTKIYKTDDGYVVRVWY